MEVTDLQAVLSAASENQKQFHQADINVGLSRSLISTDPLMDSLVARHSGKSLAWELRDRAIS